jgi:hypothetical protein
VIVPHSDCYGYDLATRRNATRPNAPECDETAKAKILHHLKQVNEIFDKLEIEEGKREKLHSRLDELRAEINQPRTRFDRFAALTMEVSGVVGDAIERSKIIEILDAIGRVFYGAQTEKQKQLPPAKEQKRIEPPRPKIEAPRRTDMDDDIRFRKSVSCDAYRSRNRPEEDVRPALLVIE